MQGSPEVSSEARVSIRYDGLGEAMVFEDMVEEELCYAATGDVVVGCDEVRSFAEAVDDDEDGIVVVRGCGKTHDEIERDLFPFALGNGCWFEKTLW
jgi:hypothetical protein